jgi:multidrug transporter EmrE-like cation transporter
VLARVPLSVAYPFVALGLVLTTAFAVIILGEAIHCLTIVGIALITAGVCLIGR